MSNTQNQELWESVAEYLDEKLGRDATDYEIMQHIEHLESNWYDVREAELKGN